MRWPFMRKPKRVIIAVAANPLAAENRSLNSEIDRLRTQVAELLPFALFAAKWCEQGQLVGPSTGWPEAQLLLRNHVNGEYEEVNQ